MKRIFYLLFILFSLHASAQNISGLYTGTLVNDSTKKVQNYELALSEYRGKITGYSYTTFVVNDTFYYSIKRIKAVKENNNLIVEDVKMLANNFPESPAKHVHQSVTIPLPAQDIVTYLNGTWKTNPTKVYYSLHGGLDMKRDNDSSHSALINHLTELQLVDHQASDEKVAATKVKVKEDKQKVKTENKNNHPMQTASVVLPAEQRTTKVLQTLEVASDSLVLSFYDNGIVDGDTISVYLNGQKIIAQHKLTEAAVKKTIATHTTADSLQLTLVAESLGTIPPNTGLLVVQDGDKRYVVTFSADMQTNAAIVFRKSKSQ